MISQRVQAAFVVLFVLVIAGVVAMLLMRAEHAAPGSSAPPRDSGEDLESAALDPVGRVSLVAGKGDVLLRLRAGSCTEPGGPMLQLSDDRGSRFRTLRLPQVEERSGVSASTPSVRAIVWAKASSRFKITVAAADGSCKLRQYATSDGGETWNAGTKTVEEWYLDPKSGGVVSPTGDTDPGCESVAHLARVTDSMAKVFCADGTILSTRDGGESWLASGRLEKVSSALFTSALVGFASTERSACQSRIQSTIDGGLTWTSKGCVEPTVTIPAFIGSTKQLIAGGLGGVRLSSDGGSTWKPPPQR